MEKFQLKILTQRKLIKDVHDYKRSERLIVLKEQTASLDNHSLFKGFPLKREVLPRELIRYFYHMPLESLPKAPYKKSHIIKKANLIGHL